MAKIVLYDSNNMPGKGLSADLIMGISASDNVYQKIKELATLIDTKINIEKPGWANVLYIVSHYNSSGLHLGSGIDHRNVTKIFSPLRFKIGSIVIQGCGATMIYKKASNGILLCKRLAHTVYANVSASNIPVHAGFFVSGSVNDRQHINHIETVGTWNAWGRLIMLEQYNEKRKLLEGINDPNNFTAQMFQRSCIVVTASKPARLLENRLMPRILRMTFSFFYHQMILPFPLL